MFRRWRLRFSGFQTDPAQVYLWYDLLPTNRHLCTAMNITMIDVKQAVQAAESYVRSLFPESELRHLRLEEVDRSEDGSRWNITLGWLEPAVAGNGIVFTAGMRKLPRVYKLFEVDAETGEVTAMKIRDVG